MAELGVSVVVTGLRRRREGSPASSLSDFSGWRGGALYPLAGGGRAARRRRRFLFDLIDGDGRARGISVVATGLRRRGEGSPASSRSRFSGWRGGALYPLAGGSRAARRRRRFLFDLIDGDGRARGSASLRPACAGVGRGLRRLLALDFQAGAAVLFIHWRVAAERRGGAGDFFLT